MKLMDWAGRDINVPVDGAAVDAMMKDAATRRGLPVYGYRYDTKEQAIDVFFDPGSGTLEKVSIYIGDIITGTPRVVSPGLKTLVI